METFYCSNIELKTFKNLYVAGYENKLRRDSKLRYGNCQVKFIALVLHLGLESILITLNTVYIFSIIM